MTVRNLGILIILISFCVSCGQPVNPYLEDNFEPDFDITITEERQLVKRYDCENNLVSESIETVTSPTKIIRVDPFEEDDEWSYSYGDLWDFEATNVGNFSYAGEVYAGEGSFNIGLNGDSDTIKVNPGLNEISYHFTYCFYQMWNRTTRKFECAAGRRTGEIGTLSININHLVKDIPGERRINPSRSTCILTQR